MRTHGTTARRQARGGALANERGMLLVITMIIMLVVSTLAAANLIDAFLERSIARNQNNASVALNAAEGGLNEALAWLNDDTNLASIPTTANPWTRVGDPVTRTLASGGSYTLTVSFKGDDDTLRPDQDCDGDASAADIVFFNRGGYSAFAPAWTEKACPHDGGFLYKGAIFTGDPGDTGYPVITIKSQGYLGTTGESRAFREIWMDVARNKLQAQVNGAFTARAGVTTSGSSMTDGRNHNLAGVLTPGGTGCMGDKPGITYDEGIVPTEACPNANIEGNPCVDNYDPADHDGVPLQNTPWGTLGLAQADFNSMFTNNPGGQLNMTECYPAKHYVWMSGDYTGTAAGDMVKFNSASPCDNYGGIIVIHNANFDPPQWQARCSAPGDPYCTVDADGNGRADNAPAVFNMNGNVQWTGIVIADQVVRVNGTPTILGGVISLASGGIIDSDITGNISIKYSCEAVSGSTNQGYKTRLGWHRKR